MRTMKIMFSLFVLFWFVSLNAQDNNQQGNAQKWETQIKQNADDLAQNLKARLNLDESETSKISDILAEYNRRVWGIKYHLIPGSPNVTLNPNDSTDNNDQAAARSQDKTDNNMSPEQKNEEYSGTTGSRDSVQYYAGLGRAEIENLRDADRTTDQDIVNVLAPDQQQKYVDVKVDWWAVVKDRIYNTSYNKNLQGNPGQNDMDNHNESNENWK